MRCVCASSHPSSDAQPQPPRFMLPLSHRLLRRVALAFATVCMLPAVFAQIGTRFPSERKVVADPVTGIPVTFLTSQEQGDSKIYQTHHQWTSDGQWLIFRSNRVKGEAMAVNEKSGEIVQVTEGGYTGMLNIARKSMKLYFLRNTIVDSLQRQPGDSSRRQRNLPMQV